MVKEAGLGLSIALLIFLAWQGFNVLPYVFLGGLSFLFIFLMEGRGLGNNGVNVSDTPKTADISFSDIGGQKKAKNELLEALDFIREDDKLKNLGIRPLKGILLSGPPGTGKTLLARAAANYTDSIFLAVSGSEFIEMYAGVGAKRIRQLFARAKGLMKNSKSKSGIIFIDEIDVLGAKRGQVASHMEYDQTLNQLLVEMDGLEKEASGKLLILAATNRIDVLDNALLRPGRFDRIVRVDLPDKDSRLHILKIHTKDKPLEETSLLEKIARETFGFSGAHLENLTNEAAILAMREDENVISYKHFMEAIEKVMLGEKTDNVPTLAEKKRICIHEAGHALISELLIPGSVANITISPRGGALGYVRQNPQEDKYLQTEDDLLKAIAVKIAGSLAEGKYLGCKSTGALQDLRESYGLAKLIIRSGMSDLGYVDADCLPQNLWHQEIARILEQTEKKVLELFQTKGLAFQKIWEELLKEERLNGDQLRNLLESNVEGVHV